MLQTLIEKEAIRDAVSRYCLYVDTLKFREFADLFTPKGRFVAGFAAVEGRDNIHQMMIDLVPVSGVGSKRKHYSTNLIIDLKGEQAFAKSIFLLVRDSAEGMMLAMAGTYEFDLLRSSDGQWLIQQVKVIGDIDGDLGFRK